MRTAPNRTVARATAAAGTERGGMRPRLKTRGGVRRSTSENNRQNARYVTRENQLAMRKINCGAGRADNADGCNNVCIALYISYYNIFTSAERFLNGFFDDCCCAYTITIMMMTATAAAMTGRVKTRKLL